MGNFIQQYRRPLMLSMAVFLGVLIAISGYKLPLLWTQPVATKAPVNVTAVQIGTINKPIHIIRAGSVEKATFTAINAEVSGKISEIYVSEGQTVKASQALLKLEGSVMATENENSSAGQQAGQKAGAPRQIPDSYDNALKEYNRCQKLYEQGAIPRKQMENALARLQDIQKTMGSGQSSTSFENSPVKSSTGSVTIKAPIDGIVTGLAASGKPVQAGQQLMALGSGQDVEIIARLEQNDLYLVHLGTQVIIQLANQTVAGRVSSIYPEIQGNQITAFLAHIKPANNSEGFLKPGTPANIQIDTEQTATVPALPRAAVWNDAAGQHFIYIAANGKVVRRQVNTGEAIGDFIEVNSDLPSESLIITSNIEEIKNGDAIIVKQ